MSELQRAVDRLRRLSMGVEKSQDIYEVAYWNFREAAKEVKAKIICDQRLVIDCCIVSRPLESYLAFASVLCVEEAGLDYDAAVAVAKAMHKRGMVIPNE